MIRRVTALQRGFRIQSWREFVIEYDDHSCTNEPRPMQHIRCRQGGIIFRAHSIFVEVGSRYIRPIFIAGTRASRYLREESKVNWNPTLDSCESFTFVSFTGTNDMYRRYNMCAQQIYATRKNIYVNHFHDLPRERANIVQKML